MNFGAASGAGTSFVFARASGSSCAPPQVLYTQAPGKETQVQVTACRGTTALLPRMLQHPPWFETSVGTWSFKGPQTGFLGTLRSHPCPSGHTALSSFPGMMSFLPIFPHEDTLIMGRFHANTLKKQQCTREAAIILLCNISVHCINDPLQIIHFLTNH